MELQTRVHNTETVFDGVRAATVTMQRRGKHTKPQQ
jgi:hypothetical protein